jgi:hypothetical protein
MSSRTVVVALLICFPVVLTSCSPGKSPTAQQGGPKATVTLSLSQVAVERSEKDVLFICQAVIDNATGVQLTVKSNYHSAFDGLDLVVMDERGRKLAQQPYLHHQSLFSLEERSFPLKEGKNCRELRFPVSGLPQNRREYRLLLVGTLPGSEYSRNLCSNLVGAAVKRTD